MLTAQGMCRGRRMNTGRTNDGRYEWLEASRIKLPVHTGAGGLRQCLAFSPIKSPQRIERSGIGTDATNTARSYYAFWER